MLVAQALGALGGFLRDHKVSEAAWNVVEVDGRRQVGMGWIEKDPFASNATGVVPLVAGATAVAVSGR